jgi:sugar lactone lactonase YvrE
MKIIRRASLTLFTLFVLMIAIVYWMYGRGQVYPDMSTNPPFLDSQLQVLVALDYPPGNVAVSADSRIFFNYHPLAHAERFAQASVFELVVGKPKPFPDLAFQKNYQGPLGMTVDNQQRLWIIEPAFFDHEQTALLAFDLKTNKLVFSHSFPKGVAQFGQDLRVSPDGGTVYIADTGALKFTRPSIGVFDVATGAYRALLAEHPSTQAQDWTIQTPFGPYKMLFGLLNITGGADGIALQSDGKWLYYAALDHDGVFKIPTDALNDVALSPSDLASRVERVGSKPMSDGMTIDAAGNILITDVEHGGISRIDRKGQLQTLVKSPRVIWADGIVSAPDGAAIFTDSALPAYVGQLTMPPSQEKLMSLRPFRIYRLPLQP